MVLLTKKTFERKNKYIKMIKDQTESKYVSHNSIVRGIVIGLRFLNELYILR